MNMMPFMSHSGPHTQSYNGGVGAHYFPGQGAGWANNNQLFGGQPWRPQSAAQPYGPSSDDFDSESD